MDVPLNPDLPAKQIRLAAHQGRASEVLVVEDVERLVNYDEWFLREVEKGLARVTVSCDRSYPGRRSGDSLTSSRGPRMAVTER
jgi:hypothetical protein